jgi:hypothetical protein
MKENTHKEETLRETFERCPVQVSAGKLLNVNTVLRDFLQSFRQRPDNTENYAKTVSFQFLLH